MTSLSLWRNSPGSLLDSWETWTKEMDRLLSSADRSNFIRQPACDISESDNAYMIEFDMPGVKSDEIDIQIDSNQLVISATRKRENEVNEENFHRIERHYGEYRRTFSLPQNVEVDQIEADYSDGVLTVALPKSEVAKPKKIKIGGKTSGLLKRLVTDKRDQAKAANA